MTWRTLHSAPRDGRRILATDGTKTFVCYPKVFPRPDDELRNRKLGKDGDWVSAPGDIWEYFRDDDVIPGHSWSFCPTHWMPLPRLPKKKLRTATCVTERRREVQK
jgi:hypothetical protein